MAAAPSDLYRVSNQQRRQPIRPYSPSYKDAMYDDEPWPPRENAADRESEYYYKEAEGYQSTPDYNSLHYESSGTKDRHYGDDNRKRYQEEERNHFGGGEGRHRDRHSHDEDDDFGRNRHSNRNHDIGELDYHDQGRYSVLS